MGKSFADDQDYQALKAILAATWRVAFEDAAEPPPGLDPISMLEHAETAYPGRASAGLKEAVNDVLSLLAAWEPERLRALDADLARNGVMTASQALTSHSRKIGRLLERGEIRSEGDCRLLQGVLDIGGGGWTESDRDRVVALLNAFERRKASR